MGVGDEANFTEELYHQIIGRLVATIEVFSKRIVAKDQYIAKLEARLAGQDGEVKDELPE